MSANKKNSWHFCLLTGAGGQAEHGGRVPAQVQDAEHHLQVSQQAGSQADILVFFTIRSSSNENSTP
jgi:hypothetical protein